MKKKIGWLDTFILSLLVLFFLYVFVRIDRYLVYKWNWSEIWQYFLLRNEEKQQWVSNILLDGFFVTFKLSLWAGFLAIFIGIIFGIGKNSKHKYISWLSRTYIEFIRNIPPLVFIFLFYFFLSSQIVPLINLGGLSDSLGTTQTSWLEFFFIKKSLLENFLAGVLCLALFESAYVAEIVWAGLRSIGKDQWEASHSLGLSLFQTMRFIILPQALRKVIPALTGQSISLVKDSSILSLISIQELSFSASQIISASNLRFEIWLTVACIYFMVCLLLSVLARRIEKKSKLKRN